MHRPSLASATLRRWRIGAISSIASRRAYVVAQRRSDDDTKPLLGLNFYDQQITRPWTEIRTGDEIGIQFLYDSGRGKISPVESAHVLARNLPARLLFCVQQFLRLPFILGCNPHFKRVHKAYLDAYQTASAFSSITTDDEEQVYVELLKSFVDDHMDVIANLASGVQDCRRHHKYNTARLDAQIDSIVRARIGIRLLVEHQIGLHLDRPHHVGVINTKFKPVDVIKACVRESQTMCSRTYGIAPEVEIDGHVDSEACYVVAHLEYIVMELLKNAFRATIEHHSGAMDVPPVKLTLSNSRDQFTVRISDQGGGFPREISNSMWTWSYSTVDQSAADHGISALGQHHDVVLAGLGVGLPMSKAYATYFGGSVEVRSLIGLGSDAFVTLPMLHEHHDKIIWSPYEYVQEAPELGTYQPRIRQQHGEQEWLARHGSWPT
eukprot:TRINITY_DN9313_c0_g1_i2.p1 TRINITY_DN9313_c0_g1~~TRINITY_DN9313_c0_g1_i2.p1  ORF type:complete len:436 (+),score=69.28 TRINITY_DN9313_c0_g1_i2:42-1349(+)